MDEERASAAVEEMKLGSIQSRRNTWKKYPLLSQSREEIEYILTDPYLSIFHPRTVRQLREFKRLMRRLERNKREFRMFMRRLEISKMAWNSKAY